MSDDGSVLSQAEIDALFRQATGTNITRPAATNPPAPAVSVVTKPISPAPPPKSQPKMQPVAPVAQRTSVQYDVEDVQDNQLNGLKTLVSEQKAQIDTLNKRLTKIEADLHAVSQTCGPVNNPSVQRQILDFSSSLRRISQHQANMQKGLESTPGYNLGEEFTCTECGSHGCLAVPVTCTGCGKEGWWGWWPKDS